jgi:hypothetical protein
VLAAVHEPVMTAHTVLGIIEGVDTFYRLIG